MAEFKLSAASFPTLDDQDEVIWAPLFISPILGSPERLVAALAVAGDDNRVVTIANSLQKLNCLYGDSSDLIMIAVQAAISDFKADLSKRGKDAIISPKQSMQILSVGKARTAIASDLHELASGWLNSISSLQNSNGAGFELLPNVAEISKKKRVVGDPLPADVFKFAFEKRSPVSKYFNTSLKGRKRSRSLISDISVDFKGEKVVANFTTIRSVQDIRREFDRILRKLWELDVTQVREGHANSDAVNYELILQKPDFNQFKKEGERLTGALEELEGQADEKRLRLLQFTNVEQMVSHLENKEAA